MMHYGLNIYIFCSCRLKTAIVTATLVLISVCPLAMHAIWHFCDDFCYSSVCDGYIATVVSVPW